MAAHPIFNARSTMDDVITTTNSMPRSNQYAASSRFCASLATRFTCQEVELRLITWLLKLGSNA